MLKSFGQLSRTRELVDASVGCFTFNPDNGSATNRTAVRHGEGFSTSVFGYADNFRNNLSGFADYYRITDSDIFAFDFVRIVKTCSLNYSPSQVNGSEDSHRSENASSADRDFDVE